MNPPNTIDLYADIIPGKSAAGFTIGQKLDDIKSTITNISKWERGKESFMEAYHSNQGWMAAESVFSIGDNHCREEYLYFKDIVDLHFNTKGILYQIVVNEGYKGALWGDIHVGDKLARVHERCPLYYDDEEIHYPDDENGPIKGLGIYADNGTLEDEPDQLINGFSIHDWALMREV